MLHPNVQTALLQIWAEPQLKPLGCAACPQVPEPSHLSVVQGFPSSGHAVPVASGVPVTHPPLWHVPAALQAVAAAQACPQLPQFAALVFLFVSQPLSPLPSQLPQPDVQLTTVQTPAVHPPCAFARVHAWPQLPQLELSLVRSRHTHEVLVLQAVAPVEQVPPR
jgi:hypothetical protein